MAVTWLGTSSGNPTIERNVSCTVVRVPHHAYLIDCGEGSHRQLPAAELELHTVHRCVMGCCLCVRVCVFWGVCA